MDQIIFCVLKFGFEIFEVFTFGKKKKLGDGCDKMI